MKQFKYIATFASSILPVISIEKDKYLAKASMEKLKSILPDIDTNQSWDLLPIAFQAFNYNKFNRNDDGVDAKTAVNIYKSFIHKNVNIEHSNSVLGVTLSSYLTEYGTNKILDEKDVLDQKSPGNVSMGAVIWKRVNRDLAAKIEECNDPESPYFGKIFTSFEVGFSDYDIVKIDGDSRNLEDGVIIGADEFEQYDKVLTCNGGSGKIGNSYFYRLIKGDVTGLGMAIVASPAGFLEPIVVKDPENDEISEEEDANATVNNEKSVTNDINSVKDNTTVKTMKTIKSKSELTDEVLKECTASNILEVWDESIKEASEKWSKERSEKENAIKAANEKIDAQKAEFEKLQTEFNETKQKLDEFVKAAEAQKKQDTFNVRMASIQETYELADDEKGVIAKDIKDLDDEAYAGYESKLAVLMKDKSKKAIAAAKEAKEKAEAEAKAKESTQTITASTTSATVVDDAIDNADKDKVELPNASTLPKKETLKEKYAKAFELNEQNFVLKTKNR